MDRHWLAEDRQQRRPAADLAAEGGREPVGRALLDRAEAAARLAGDLAVEWFWLRQAVLGQRAERLSTAAERRALAAHRTGRLWPPRRIGFLAQGSRRAAPRR
jgi:hypothetical protein